MVIFSHKSVVYHVYFELFSVTVCVIFCKSRLNRKTIKWCVVNTKLLMNIVNNIQKKLDFRCVTLLLPCHLKDTDLGIPKRDTCAQAERML